MRSALPPLTASLEDYLETILKIVQAKQAARAKDIADRLKVRKPSVTGALKILAERGLVNYAPYDIVTLTPEGRSRGEEILRRHEILRDFFINVLSLSPTVAEEGACRMEHAIPPAIVERFVKFLDYLEMCPRGGNRWTRDFDFFCRNEKLRQSCETCLAATLKESRRRRRTAAAARRIPLHGLKLHQKGIIKRVKGKGQLRQRLEEMGVVANRLIKMEGASRQNSIQLVLGGRHHQLSAAEAGSVIVLPL